MMSLSSPPPGDNNSQHQHQHQHQQQQQQQQRPGFTMPESRIPTARGAATTGAGSDSRSERLQVLSQKYNSSSSTVPNGLGGALRSLPGGGASGSVPPMAMGGGYMHNVVTNSKATSVSMNGGPPTEHFGNRPSQAGIGIPGGPPIGSMFGARHGQPANAPLQGLESTRSYSIEHSPKMPRSNAQILSPASPGIVSKHLAASVTAAAVNSPARSVSQPRRLEHSFPANQGLALPMTPLTTDDVTTRNATASAEMSRSRSKSAPPNRPPPPRGGPPAPSLEHPPEASKSVSFPNMAMSPGSTQNQGPSQPRAASTPYPGNAVAASSMLTPDEGASMTALAGATPYFATTSTPTEIPASSDSSTTRSDLLRHMRDFADTPHKEPNGAATSTGSSTAPVIKTPELRLHEQLATAEKEKATALRQVAKLQDEITQIRLSTSTKQVGFQSPLSPGLAVSSPPRRRFVSTPFPKVRKVLISNATSPDTVDDERQLLVEAVESTVHEYDRTGTTFTFIVRRPYGASQEVDFWYKAGQLPTKRYVHSADVFRPESIEVAATVGADGSIFVLFGKDEVRHQTATGLTTDYGSVGNNDFIMGNVSYIDNDANEKDYSLEELYLGALGVRDHYCASVLSFAAALKFKSPTRKSPFSPGSPDVHIAETPVEIPRVTETADKSVATEAPAPGADKDVTAKSEAAPKKRAPPVEEESTTDVLATFIQMFFSFLFGMVWFLLIGLPLRILTTTFVMSVSAVLVSYVWLYFADDNGAGTIGSSMHVYANQPGIL